MSQFSAQEPSLGYHYQIRYSLYLLLKTKDKDDHFIKLENLDDVEVGDINRIDLHQTKFHNKKAANLSDASVDIWKTIRVWSEMFLKKEIDLDNALLVLVTTSPTSPKSILKELTDKKDGDKTIDNITAQLENVTRISENKQLETSFEAFNKLSSVQKKKLIQCIHIKDNALNFEGLKKSIQKELELVCLPQYIERVYQDLEGWWYEQCIQHLQGNKDSITYDETRRYIIYLNDSLKSDNLPIDVFIRDSKIDDNEYDDRLFVSQLKIINIGKNALRVAKRDYYRASEQRSKWIREKLVDPQEEIDYEARLKDDWHSKFAILKDDVEGLSEEVEVERCKDFYIRFYGNSCPLIHIRPKVTDIFIIRGSCHMLIDNQNISWHPNYPTI